jgi:D-tyrosyl-tRNA(Tyr) deacylase
VRALIQRVTLATVTVDNQIVGEIARGFLVLLGVTHSDSEAEASQLAAKIASLRVFDDETGNLNRSALDLISDSPDAAGVLVVSQFTLYADAKKGRRPSFVRAAPPEIAAPLVDQFANHLRSFGLHVEQGVFGAEMMVEIVNDGPVTIWLDTDEL